MFNIQQELLIAAVLTPCSGLLPTYVLPPWDSPAGVSWNLP